jgi:hypothetical protein
MGLIPELYLDISWSFGRFSDNIFASRNKNHRFPLIPEIEFCHKESQLSK